MEKDYVAGCLRRWCESGQREQLLEIYAVLQRLGHRDASSAEMRAVAQENLRDGSHADPLHDWLLRRLQSSQPPTFDAYTGESVTRLAVTDGDPLITLANVAEVVSELLGGLLREDFLVRLSDEQRTRVQGRIEKLLDQVRDLQVRVGAEPRVHYAVGSVPEVVERLLVPESAVPEEIVFLRIVQATNVIFYAVANLLKAARSAAALGDLAGAALLLDRAFPTARLLQPLAGAHSLIPTDIWHSFRPLIVEPSALQGENFPDLVVEVTVLVNEAQRIMSNPRIPEDRRAFEPLCTALLADVNEAVDRWHSAHAPMTKSKNGEGEGSRWLEEQRGNTLPAVPGQPRSRREVRKPVSGGAHQDLQPE
ncbi:hypothetical protein ACFU7X_03040 [Streptomyces chartreusis]|uniref:hypothetical protein n=1 Tax=Streptomyces chartreusis TaxID=1969 RepID=UPI0036B7BFE4